MNYRYYLHWFHYNILRENKVLIALSLFCFLLHLPYLIPSFGPTTDESLYILAGKEALEGSTLYTDIYIDKPPALIYLFAIIIYFFGINIQLIRLIIAIANVFSMLILYNITKRFYSHKEAMISATFFSILIANPIFESFIGRTDTFMLLFSLMGLSLILKAIHESNKKYIILGGLCIGLSILFKQPGILQIPLLFLIIIIQDCKNDIITKVKIHRMLIFSIGIISPIIITILIMVQLGAWDEMYNQTISTWFSFAETRTTSSSNLNNLYGNVTMIIQTFNQFPIIFYSAISGLIVVIYSFFRKFNRKIFQELKNNNRNSLFDLFKNFINSHNIIIIIVSWIIIIFIFLIITPSRISYLVVLFPPMCIMSSKVFVNLHDNINKLNNNQNTKDFNFIKYFTLVFVLILLFAPLTPDIYPGQFMGKDSIYNENNQILEASDYLKSHTSKDDIIYTFCYLPEIYIYTNLKPASIKYGTFQPNYVNAPNSKEISEEILLGLVNNKPKYIITVETSRMEIIKNTGSWWKNYNDVVDYIKINYTVETYIQASEYDYWPRGDIYIWRNSETLNGV